MYFAYLFNFKAQEECNVIQIKKNSLNIVLRRTLETNFITNKEGCVNVNFEPIVISYNFRLKTKTINKLKSQI